MPTLIEQNSRVNVWEYPPTLHSNPEFSPHSKTVSPSPIYPNDRENFENYFHGKSDIWVERGDFYRSGEFDKKMDFQFSGESAGTSPFTAFPPLAPFDAPSDFQSTIEPQSLKGTKKKRVTLESDPYLLVGFDTEYKTPEFSVSKQDIVEGKAKYVVLSYQFHAKTSDGLEWSGICCPEAGERMSLPEFLIFVLGMGSRRYGATNLPTQIYMVGHFTRADIPAFRDFRDLKSEFMNIRNTFATPNAAMTIGITFPNGSPITLSVGIRDTMLLTPATSKKLSALGELLGLPKKVMQTEDHDHEWLICHMDYTRDNHWALFKDYAITDATIAMLYGERVISLYEEVVGEKKFPLTLSSIGVDLLTEKLTSNEPPLFNLLFGLESHTGKQFSKRRNHYFKVKKSVPLIEVKRYEQEATECYHGGRNEQFWFGPGFEDTWTDYDLQSAYPTAMALIGIPIWSDMFTTNDVSLFTPTTLGYVDVEFEFPPSVRYPVLPVRTDNGIIFPRTGRSRCSAPELFVANQLGAQLKIRFGLIVPTNPEIRPFEDFTKDCIERRSSVGKKTLEGLFWKEIINSTYGKTAQGLLEKRVYSLRNADTTALGPSKITNPYLAAFITSAVRAILGEMMNGLPSDKLVFSCTTDGFITNASEHDMLLLAKGALYQSFSNARLKLTGDPSVLEVKHVIRKPLGWRTRGQATLVAGDVLDCNALEDQSIVLAKGGIYLPKYLDSDKLQNNFIVNLFFNRQPDSMINVIGSVGIREIMQYGADLVEKQSTKRLSMEYDWKRCPLGTTNDPCTGHLVFSTKPWDSVNQFLLVRDAWDQYIKIEQACLKRVVDLQNFASFAETRLLLSDEVKRYLPKRDGDLKRLRMAFCTAYKHSRAGLDPHTSGYSAQDIADLLILCGMPCTKTDVENGKKRPFTPNRVPPTHRVQQAIVELKFFFPTLDERELLFRNESDGFLKLGASTGCPFVNRLVAD